MQTRSSVALVIIAMLGVSSAYGATFAVPDDDWLTQRSDAIASGTVVGSRVERNAAGLIETIYSIELDEAFKGLDADRAVVEVHEIGGSLDGETLHVSGTPAYQIGTRYLVFLRRVGQRWVTFDLLVGKFTFETNELGETILARDENLVDVNRMARTRQTSVRLAREFIPHIRDLVRQGSEDRFTSLTTAVENDSEPGDVFLATAIAAAAWSSDSASEIGYSVSTRLAGGVMPGDDDEARVIPGDPQNLIAGTFGVDSSVLAVAIYGCRTGECLPAENEIQGMPFANITWADVVFNDVGPSITLNQSILNTILAHEFGHTLGFRHSNRIKNDPDVSDPSFVCADPYPCSETAVMTSTVDESRNGQLTSWDQDAAAAVYGNPDGTEAEAAEYVDDMYVESFGGWYPARRADSIVEWRVTGAGCQATAILEQPESVVIENGRRADLSVSAAGSGLEYRWFEGETGDRTHQVGEGTRFTTPFLSDSTRYWVLVSSPCGDLESSTAEVEVIPECPLDALCALSNRFTIRLRAVDQRTNRSGGGEAHPQSDMFGFFSVPGLTGNSENPEVFVKMLDGRAVNDEFWVFYGGLTDLEYTLTVLDNETGETRSYFKPAGSTAGGYDIGDGVARESCPSEIDGLELSPVSPSPCIDEMGDTCLEGGRFRVDIVARDQRSGRLGEGERIRQNDVSGYFALPAITGNPANPEVFVKVLDGRGVNGYFWVFFSGLTDLEYTVVVTDTESGFRKAYTKPPGSACGAFDTNAF